MLPDEGVPFGYRYLRKTDAAYWQVTDPDRVWDVSKSDSFDNVENPDFKFAGSTYLTQSAFFALSAAMAIL